ncbi:MAG: RnfABCDGE type electron transport complex subunit G [Bacteroidales bacterium]|nr:RnfABCDGE type electron transport complex subunit G [Bacteroidales bacterium]
MKKAQSTLINMLLSLTVIAVVAAGALALVSAVTAEPIAQAQKAKKEAAVKAVLPAFDRIEEVTIDGVACTKAYNAEGTMIGMAVESSSEKGFGGHLGVMVGFDTEGCITGYRVLETAETPGLGAKAGEWFQQGNKGDIIGKNPANPLSVKKDGGDVDAISGSTITSRAFCEAINNAYQIFQKGGNE